MCCILHCFNYCALGRMCPSAQLPPPHSMDKHKPHAWCPNHNSLPIRKFHNHRFTNHNTHYTKELDITHPMCSIIIKAVQCAARYTALIIVLSAVCAHQPNYPHPTQWISTSLMPDAPITIACQSENFTITDSQITIHTKRQLIS